jgi:molybdopterin synthase sulfur carrier subunit
VKATAPVAVLRLFAQAREAAGTGRDTIDGTTVDEVLAAARARYGEGFAALLPNCRIWVNGEPADVGDRVTADDEVAVLPPVSGGGA